MVTAIIILLLSLASIPVIINLPIIKDKIFTRLKQFKKSSRKKTGNILDELSYLYDNTTGKRSHYYFYLKNGNSEEIKINIHNSRFLYLMLELQEEIPFTIIKIKEKAALHKRKIEKKYKILLKDTFYFDHYTRIRNIEQTDYIYLLSEKLQQIIKYILSVSDIVYITNSKIIIAFNQNEKLHNILFFKKLFNYIQNFSLLLAKKTDLIQNILNNINYNSNPEIRKINLEALYDLCMDEKTVRNVLLKTLKDRYWQPAITAAKLLGDEGHEYLVNFLNHPISFVKIEAINNIKYLNKKSCRIMLNLLMHEEKKELKTAIFKMLTRLKDTGNYREIFNYLENYTNHIEQDIDFYISMIEYLRMCGQLSAVVILNRMKNHSSRAVKKAASRAVDEIKNNHNNDTDGWLTITEIPENSGSLSLHELHSGELSIQE